MKRFFSPNLERKGRIVRAVGGVVLVVAGVVLWPSSPRAGIVLLASGSFMLFEAFRGWCLVRACGIKTRM